MEKKRQGKWRLEFTEVLEPYESRLASSLHKGQIFMVRLEDCFIAVSVPQIFDIAYHTFFKLTHSFDFSHWMIHVEEQQSRVGWTDRVLADESLNFFARSALGDTPVPPLFLREKDVCIIGHVWSLEHTSRPRGYKRLLH